MKKVFVAILLCISLFLLPACASESNELKAADFFDSKTETFTFSRLEYGLSPEECLKKLGLKEDELLEGSSVETGYYIDSVSYTYLGLKYYLCLQFKDNALGVVRLCTTDDNSTLSTVMPAIKRDFKASFGEPLTLESSKIAQWKKKSNHDDSWRDEFPHSRPSDFYCNE